MNNKKLLDYDLHMGLLYGFLYGIIAIALLWGIAMSYNFLANLAEEKNSFQAMAESFSMVWMDTLLIFMIFLFPAWGGLYGYYRFIGTDFKQDKESKRKSQGFKIGFFSCYAIFFIASILFIAMECPLRHLLWGVAGGIYGFGKGEQELNKMKG